MIVTFRRGEGRGGGERGIAVGASTLSSHVRNANMRRQFTSLTGWWTVGVGGTASSCCCVGVGVGICLTLQDHRQGGRARYSGADSGNPVVSMQSSREQATCG
jgi:hypothetical protein